MDALVTDALVTDALVTDALVTGAQAIAALAGAAVQPQVKATIGHFELGRMLRRALRVSERSLALLPNPLNFLRGISKYRKWLQLDAFRENPSLFKRKLEIEKVSLAKWITLIGEPNPEKAITSNSDWLTCLISLEDTHDDVTYALTREIPAFKELSERGFVAPFLYQLAGIISDSNTPSTVLAASLEAQSEFFEQVSRRAVTLELNVASLSGELKGQTSEDRFLSFIAKFRDRGARAEFFKKYPVLARAFHERAKLWEAATFEFHERLSSDRDLLQISYGIPKNAALKKNAFRRRQT